MRSIEDIIADARQATAASFREAFALGRAERATELRARLETAFLEPLPEPARDVRQDDAVEAKNRNSGRAETRPPPQFGARAILLAVVAMLTLALWHARAARTLPAYALLIGLGALLRGLSEDNPSE